MDALVLGRLSLLLACLFAFQAFPRLNATDFSSWSSPVVSRWSLTLENCSTISFSVTLLSLFFQLLSLALTSILLLSYNVASLPGSIGTGISFWAGNYLVSCACFCQRWRPVVGNQSFSDIRLNGHHLTQFRQYYVSSGYVYSRCFSLQKIEFAVLLPEYDSTARAVHETEATRAWNIETFMKAVCLLFLLSQSLFSEPYIVERTRARLPKVPASENIRLAPNC